MINAGDTAWVLIAAALVMLMTPGVSFFYAGLVRQKNVLSMLGQSFALLALVSVQWVLCGYSLAFGPDHWGLIGGFAWLGLSGVGSAPYPAYASTIPHEAYMVFQLMFAVITPMLITGAFAERKRFKPFLLFSLLWTTLVYDPIAHWVWGQGGWLQALGALDFAGGTVVHISSGVSGLVTVLVLGPRLGHGQESLEHHNAPLTLLGAGLLWFGWFGFNAGSALGANGVAATAFITTNSAAAMGVLTWVTLSWAHKRRPSVIGGAVGAVAGLVAITPAAGFVSPPAAILIGLGAALCCYGAVQIKHRLMVDDALDAWFVHGIGGIWGALATGVFATVVVNAAGANGLLFGNPEQLAIQALAVVAVLGYAAGMTWLILKGLGLFMALRASELEELVGLDASQHGESAYKF